MKKETERVSSQAKIDANRRYNDKMVKRYNLAFNKGTDVDIIEHLDRQENKQGYIKELIRKDMKGGKK